MLRHRHDFVLRFSFFFSPHGTRGRGNAREWEMWMGFGCDLIWSDMIWSDTIRRRAAFNACCLDTSPRRNAADDERTGCDPSPRSQIISGETILHGVAIRTERWS
jgi:hypothetical protein